MKRLLLHAGLLLLLGAFAFAQDTPPTGTHQSPNEPNAVRPTKKAGKGVKSAPGNMGRGAKAAGHDVKEGHPVEAGKSIGEGAGRFLRRCSLLIYSVLRTTSTGVDRFSTAASASAGVHVHVHLRGVP